MSCLAAPFRCFFSPWTRNEATSRDTSSQSDSTLNNQDALNSSTNPESAIVNARLSSSSANTNLPQDEALSELLQESNANLSDLTHTNENALNNDSIINSGLYIFSMLNAIPSPVYDIGNSFLSICASVSTLPFFHDGPKSPDGVDTVTPIMMHLVVIIQSLMIISTLHLQKRLQLLLLMLNLLLIFQSLVKKRQ